MPSAQTEQPISLVAGGSWDRELQRRPKDAEAGIVTIQEVTCYVVRKQDRWIAYEVPLAGDIESLDSTNKDAIITWLNNYSHLKADATQAKVQDIVTKLGDPVRKWGMTIKPRPADGKAESDEDEELRCTFSPKLDGRNKGLGKGRNFPCVVPVAELTEDGEPNLVPTGHCLGCLVRGKHCSRALNTATGTRTAATVSHKNKTRWSDANDNGLKAFELLFKDMAHNSVNKHLATQVRSAFNFTRKQLKDADVLGHGSK